MIVHQSMIHRQILTFSQFSLYSHWGTVTSPRAVSSPISTLRIFYTHPYTAIFLHEYIICIYETKSSWKFLVGEMKCLSCRERHRWNLHDRKLFNPSATLKPIKTKCTSAYPWYPAIPYNSIIPYHTLLYQINAPNNTTICKAKGTRRITADGSHQSIFKRRRNVLKCLECIWSASRHSFGKNWRK